MKNKIKNAYAYFQGNLRYFAYTFFSKSLLPKHIRQQIETRFFRADIECITNEVCLQCGCDMPQLLFANKSCGGNCYPKIVDKKEWNNQTKQL
jgi:hypothetical protein